MTPTAWCAMMAEVVRLRDLGGGEPNDALTWALFDDSDAGGDVDDDDAGLLDRRDEPSSELAEGAPGTLAHE